MDTIHHERTKPLSGIAAHLRIALIVFAINNLVFVTTTAMIILGPQFDSFSEPGGLPALNHFALLTWLNRLAVIVFWGALIWSAIMLSRWIIRAVSNLRRRGVKSVYPPALEVAGLFVPVVGMIAPALSLRRIWHGSLRMTRQPDIAPPYLLTVWWVCWVLSSSLLVALVVDAATLWPILSAIVEPIEAVHMEFPILALASVASLCLWRLVLRISTMQDHRNTDELVEVFD